MASSGYQVTSQLMNQVRNTDTGNTVEGNYIYFVTTDGNSGVVFVPTAIYASQSKVKMLLSEQANLIDAIGRLSEPASS
jgi:hypothetical protein